MFKQNPEKVEANPLRRALHERGYSMRAAAAALGVSLSQLAHTITAHDPDHDLAERILDLPARHEKATR